MTSSQTTLDELAVDVQGMCGRLQAGASDVSRIAAAQAANERLAGAASDLVGYLPTLKELRKAGATVDLHDVLGSLHVSIPDDPFGWLASGQHVDLVDAVQRVVRQMGLKMREAWKGRLTSFDAPPADEATIRILRTMTEGSSLAPLVKRLADLSTQHRLMVEEDGPEPDEGVTVPVLEHDLKDVWERLQAGGLSPERVELLRVLGSPMGVRLSTVSASQLDWLMQSGVAQSLVVKRQLL